MVKCFVPNCTSGYASCREKVSMFKAPKDPEILSKWQRAIPRKDKLLSNSDFVCEKHFFPECVIRTWKIGETEGIYKRPKLKSHAIPAIFPNCPTYLSKSATKKRRILNRTDVPSKKVKSTNELDVVAVIGSENDYNVDQIPETFFKYMWRQDNIIDMPSKAWSSHKTQNCDKKVIVFSQVLFINESLISKNMVWYEDQHYDVFVSQKPIIKSNPFYENLPLFINNEDTLIKIIYQLNNSFLCMGGPNLQENENIMLGYIFKDNAVWRHNNCLFLSLKNNICKYCNILKYRFQQCKTRRNKRNIVDRKKMQLKRKYSQRVYKLKKKAMNLSDRLEQLTKKFKIFSEEKFKIDIEKLNLSPTLKNVVSECFKLGKYRSKVGRRYTGDWILTCLILRIRSGSTYRFLQENEILPLPALSTIKRYLRRVKIKCGLDEPFFEALKLKISEKDEQKRHGILVFDEIQVRKSLNVNVKTMKYEGVVDFGDQVNTNIDAKHSDVKLQLADHGLVFMFSSLRERFLQPVAVYAASGPTRGCILAKLLLEVIIKLENCGLFVDAVICDGATTNRKVWNEFGISGKINSLNNKIIHPNSPQLPNKDNKRYLYFLSDTPHLFKCIRNKMLKEDILQPPEGQISWKYYVKLYEEDVNLPSSLRVCPKITLSHIDPSNMMKMRVKLATQIFSNSVADGIQFYKDVKCQDEFKFAEPTILFTKKINDMFDLLNCKNPKKGLSLESDFNIFNKHLEWLSDWENQTIKNRNKCLTLSTLQGLRVTLKSVLELSEYLLKKCNFQYVLTGKLNQDCLENFFGMIRQACGSNDHPTLIGFLQMYRMLSTYSLLKPPKYGNCIADKEYTSDIKYQDFKNIFEIDENFSQKHIHTLQEKLQESIENNPDCDVLTFLDERPLQSNDNIVLDCIVFYVTGFVIKMVLQHITCDNCKQFMLVSEGDLPAVDPESQLLLIKKRGILIHPNRNIYHLVKEVEESIKNSIDKEDIYEEAMNDLFRKEIDIVYPCENHKYYVLSTIIYKYILLRMRFHCKQQNINCPKESREKRKLAKLFNA